LSAAERLAYFFGIFSCILLPDLKKIQLAEKRE
jgi:hypothetical protein